MELMDAGSSVGENRNQDGAARAREVIAVGVRYLLDNPLGPQ